MIRCGVMSCTMPSSSLNELLHSTGKNSALWPVSTWNLGKCLARICVMLSLIMFVFRMMVVSSTTWPTPWTTKTMCEISARRSVCEHSSLYPRNNLSPKKIIKVCINIVTFDSYFQTDIYLGISSSHEVFKQKQPTFMYARTYTFCTTYMYPKNRPRNSMSWQNRTFLLLGENAVEAT